MSNFAVPVGVGASFSPVPGNSVSTASFTIDGGFKVVTFQPVDPNNPGVATLFDSGNNVRLIMNRGGHHLFQVNDGSETFYFQATSGAALLAMTTPNHFDRWN